MPTDDFAHDRKDRAEEAESQDRATAPAQDPYLAFALRWWWLLIIGGILGLAGGYGYARVGPIPYTSVAQVHVPPQTSVNPNANTNQAVDATANYSAEAATSQMFTLVSQELAGTLNLSASDLLVLQQEGAIVIKPVKGTNFITITVTDSNEEHARLLADTIAIVFVRTVNERASAQIDARQQLLEGQIEVTGQRYLTSRLNQRLEELQKQMADQRSSLLQLQSNYQQELQRQAEQDRLIGGTAQNPPELMATRARWLETINGQISDVEKNIHDTQTQMELVRTQLGTLPGSSDPSVSAAFASAYGEQLQLLTRDYAQLQLDAPAARTPLVRYGVASDPLPASGLKKILLMGGALGGVIAAALGFAIDFLRKRKAAAAEQSAPAEVAPTTVIAPPRAPEVAIAATTVTIESPPVAVEPVVAAPPVVAAEVADVKRDEAAVEPTQELVAPVTEEPAADQVTEETEEKREAVAARKPDDLIFLIERARQRRQAANNHHGENGLNGTTDTTAPPAFGPRNRPLPTQDDDYPLRRVAE